MAAFYPATFAILFDTEGNKVDYVARPNATHAPNEPALRAWQAELGFVARTVHVKQFEVPEMGLGIEDLPSHLQDFVDDPESSDEPEELAEALRTWRADDAFVLHWGNDLWLDRDGHVTSS